MDGKYVDATFGRGGHASEVLARLGNDGSLLVLDRDPAAIDYARARFADDPRVRARQAPFSEMEACVSELGWHAQVSGVLMDLGVSSPQLDEPATHACGRARAPALAAAPALRGSAGTRPHLDASAPPPGGRPARAHGPGASG